MTDFNVVDGYHPTALQWAYFVVMVEPRMSPYGTKRKCHRRLATSAFGGLTDIQIAILAIPPNCQCSNSRGFSQAAPAMIFSAMADDRRIRNRLRRCREVKP